MRTLRTINEARQDLQAFRRGRIGLVPTMGALHAGHQALIAAARAECDTVVVSVFVNPMQFDEESDFAAYPRGEERDAEVAADAGADLLFAPSATELYPPGFQTWVDVHELGGTLEGTHRPDHFRGVTTICLKLFNIVRPARAYFGQKDAQQVAVIQRMVRDLDLDLTVRSLPTVRDADGLALSSRNAPSPPRSGSSRLRFPGHSPPGTSTRPARCSTASTSTTSRSPTSTRPCSPPPCASAPPA